VHTSVLSVNDESITDCRVEVHTDHCIVKSPSSRRHQSKSRDATVQTVASKSKWKAKSTVVLNEEGVRDDATVQTVEPVECYKLSANINQV
jgi:hypothetical protein